MKAIFDKIKITPRENLPMSGYLARDDKKAKGRLDDLYCRLCILQNENITLIFLLLDLLHIDDGILKQVKHNIQKVNNKHKIILNISCTHTHSGPDIEHALSKDYRKRLTVNITELINSNLLKNKHDVKLEFGKIKIS